MRELWVDVSDKEHGSLYGALVVLKDLSSGACITVNTRDMGQVAIPLSRPGKYELSVSMGGHLNVTRKFELKNEDKKPLICIEMKRLPEGWDA